MNRRGFFSQLLGGGAVAATATVPPASTRSFEWLNVACPGCGCIFDHRSGYENGTAVMDKGKAWESTYPIYDTVRWWRERLLPRQVTCQGCGWTGEVRIAREV